MTGEHTGQAGDYNKQRVRISAGRGKGRLRQKGASNFITINAEAFREGESFSLQRQPTTHNASQNTTDTDAERERQWRKRCRVAAVGWQTDAVRCLVVVIWTTTIELRRGLDGNS